MTECDAYKLIEDFIKKSSADSPSSLSFASSSILLSTPAPFPPVPPAAINKGKISSVYVRTYAKDYELPPSSSPNGLEQTPSSIRSYSSTTSASSATLTSASSSSRRRHETGPTVSPPHSNRHVHLVEIAEQSVNNASSITDCYNQNYDDQSIQYETPPHANNLIPMINLLSNNESSLEEAKSYVQRPNRPYSYYLATNFNPLDFSNMPSLVNESNEEQPSSNKTSSPIKKQSHYEKAGGKSKSAKSQQKSSTLTRSSRIAGEVNRLSTSLSDMVRGKGDTTITNSPTRTENRAIKAIKSLTSTPISKKDKNNSSVFEDDYETVNDSKLSSRFQRATKLSSTMPTRFRSKPNYSTNQAELSNELTASDKNKSHHKSLNKINKFFRTLFRINSQSVPTEDTNVDGSHLVVLEDGEHHDESSRFIRMFSFKQNKTLKYQYNTASRTTRVQSTSSSSSSSTTNSARPQELLVSDVQPSTSFALLPQIDPASLQSSDDQYTSLIVNETSMKNLNENISVNVPSSSSSFITSTSPTVSSNTASSGCCSSSSSSTTSASDPAVAARAQIIMNEIDKAKRELKEMINFDQFRDKFYSEICDQMKSRSHQPKQDSTYFSSSTTTSSNEKSSISSIDSIDIPYIDEDEEIEDHVAAFVYSSKSLSTSSPKRDSTKHTDSAYVFDRSDQDKLRELIASPTLVKFDQLAVYYMNKCEFLWSKLAILFEMTTKTVQLMTSDGFYRNENEKIAKLKELAAGYIHDKYCEWTVYDHDGWKPDLVSLPSLSSERMH